MQSHKIIKLASFYGIAVGVGRIRSHNFALVSCASLIIQFSKQGTLKRVFLITTFGSGICERRTKEKLTKNRAMAAEYMHHV